MQFGIDKISFYTSSYYLDLKTLAAKRNIAVAKFYDDLGQKKMGICAPDEDIVTLAANAATKILAETDVNAIEHLLFATESSFDCSKSAGTYLHELLQLNPRCRVIELKQACYGATAGLQLAIALLRQNPEKKVLLIATDVAHYELNSPGESSQGAGAVAMLLTADPRILAINPESGIYTKNAMDFWRPNYRTCAFVDGRLSCDLYLTLLEKTWQQYTAISNRKFTDHAYFCYHISVPKLVEKAHKRLIKINNQKASVLEAELYKNLDYSLIYSREIGNCYTASLYLGIISLLENLPQNASNQLLGLYSYGSGCIGEYFSGQIATHYQTMLYPSYHQALLSARKELSFDEYLEFYNFTLPQDEHALDIPKFTTGNFRLSAYKQHKHIYEQVT
jgi:hydroxymethylglutaryl-CoA synthase